MTIQEKILLLEYLLVDIRLDYDKGKHKRFKDKRVWEALKILDELSNPNNETVFEYFKNGKNKEIKYWEWNKMYEGIGLYLTARWEGSLLKVYTWREGGYLGLDKIHQLSPNFSERSEEFKLKVNELLRVDYNWKRQ